MPKKEASEERVKTAAHLLERAAKVVEDLSAIVRKQFHGTTREGGAANDAILTFLDLRAAMRDLLDEEYDTTVQKAERIYTHERVEKHESYGIIQANRVSGGRKLFGSVINQHQHFIEITVQRGIARYPELDERTIFSKDLGPDHNIVKLSLSAAQWAELVTCMNIGMGIPCTLEYVRGRRMAPVPEEHENRTDRILEEFKANLRGMPKELKKAEAKLKAAIEAAGLSKKKTEELLRLVDPLAPNVEAGIPHVLEQFNEAAEKTIASARSELDATVTMVTQTLGLAELRARADVLPEGTPVRERLAEPKE